MNVRLSALKRLLEGAENIKRGQFLLARSALRDAIEIIEDGYIDHSPITRVRSYFMPGLSGGCTEGA